MGEHNFGLATSQTVLADTDCRCGTKGGPRQEASDGAERTRPRSLWRRFAIDQRGHEADAEHRQREHDGEANHEEPEDRRRDQERPGDGQTFMYAQRAKYRRIGSNVRIRLPCSRAWRSWHGSESRASPTRLTRARGRSHQPHGGCVRETPFPRYKASPTAARPSILRSGDAAAPAPSGRERSPRAGPRHWLSSNARFRDKQPAHIDERIVYRH